MPTDRTISRDKLISELADVRTRLTAKEQQCRELSEQLTQLKSMKRPKSDEFFPSGSSDCSDRKQAEVNQPLLTAILQVFNRGGSLHILIAETLCLIREATGFDAVGLRLRQGEDCPYFEQNGFSEEFLREENFLCARAGDGAILRDAEGRAVLECTCGLVLSGRTDPSMSCFTKDGSFWTNVSSELLALAPQDDPRDNPRNRCIHSGYQSVGLFPVRAGAAIIGLLQFNDRRTGRFTPELIAFYEGLAQNIGLALRRAEAEETVELSERRFRALIEKSGESVTVLDAAGKITYNIAGGNTKLGYTDTELIGRTAFELVHPDDLPRMIRLFEVAASIPGKVDQVEARIRAKDGSWRWQFAVGTNLLDDPTVGGIVINSHDVTEGKQAEEALTRSEERYRLLSETASQLITSEDPEQVVNIFARKVMDHLDCQVFFNFLADEESGRLKLNAYAGVSPETAQAIQYLDYGVAVCGCAARDRQRIIASDILNTTDPRTELIKGFGIQAYCCHPLITGEKLIGTLSFGTRTRPRFAPDEIEVMQTVAAQVAISMQRSQAKGLLENEVKERTAKLLAANRELEAQTNKLRLLAGELTLAEQRERKQLSKILHDGLQQHLVAAKMQVGGLIEEATDAGWKQAASGVESLLKESLRISRTLAAELSPPILHEAGLLAGLEWLSRWMHDKHGLKVELAMQMDAPALTEQAKVLLFESVRELLLNVVKHAGTHFAKVQLDRQGNQLRITVSDDGKGFNLSGEPIAEMSGGGFGLFSIRERITLIGGRFEADSSPGKGARFTLTAPLVTIESLEPRPEAQPAAIVGAVSDRLSKPGGKIRILLADDHAVVREGLARLLAFEPDFEMVGQVNDGRAAVELARQLSPDVILMDISMPLMNGIVATRIIRQEHPAIRIIGLSLYHEDERSREMLDAGAVIYMTKSTPPSDLKEAIRASMKMRSEVDTGKSDESATQKD
ncbi:MAG: response regulator [Hyphomicrobiales bacterium]